MLLEQYIEQLRDEVAKTETQKYRLEDETWTEHLEKYNAIIEAREKDPLLPRIPWIGRYVGEYSEKHHIRPKCVFPELKDDPKNIIRLLPKEHFAAHYHIWMHYRETGNRFLEEKMCCALMNMKKGLNNKYLQKFGIEPDIDWLSDEYSSAKKRMSELRSKPVLKYDSDGNFIKEYPSVGCVASELGIKNMPTRFRESIKQGTMFRGFAWRYKTSDEIPQKIEVVQKPPRKKCQQRGKPVLKYSLDGDFLEEFPSIKDAANDKKTMAKSIGHNCVGKRLSAYGFIWRYKSTNGIPIPMKIEVPPEQKLISQRHIQRTRAVLKLDGEGNVIERFNSVNDAAGSIGVHHSIISQVCLGVRRQAAGFSWKYEVE